MMNWRKIIIGAGVSGGLLASVAYLLKLNRANVNLETVPTVRVHKLDLQGISIRIDLLMKNPTEVSFKIKMPFVKLIYKDNSIGSSQVIDKDFVIPAFGELVISEIMVKIPMLSLFSLSGELFKALQGGSSVKLNIKTITTIDLGWKKIPYERMDEVIL